MSNSQILLFCGISLAIALGLAALLFPQATMTDTQRARLDTPQPAESLGEIDLGGYFGKVKVTELVDYYISNPPDADTAARVIEEDRFGGC
ncbi:hypothetical protein [Thiohalophilus sp.]|uniref:hypothetical protein n=1 Tax=Thiohalophilus sp. TaxID=3028392 RepID=UPI002ACD73D0|nr:hypothetical protein [Thiohalophilus sp.]MDZ7663314.1 hypothetical protein [Thiohalophilus sp.]